MTIKNCKLGTGLVIGNMPVLAMAVANIDIVNSDSGGAIYRNERYNAHGTLTHFDSGGEDRRRDRRDDAGFAQLSRHQLWRGPTCRSTASRSSSGTM